MRVVLQRVRRAAVRIEGRTVSSIGLGTLLLVGVGHGDDGSVARALADKIVGLRIFRDAEGKTNLDIAAVGGEALVVSQFTLYADTRKGRRPSFIAAADPAEASVIVEAFAAALQEHGIRVGRGVFGAEMEVDLVNDGPFTMTFDTSAGAPPVTR